jgi:hypothetical protein
MRFLIIFLSVTFLFGSYSDIQEAEREFYEIQEKTLSIRPKNNSYKKTTYNNNNSNSKNSWYDRKTRLTWQTQTFNHQDKKNFDNNKASGRVLEWKDAKNYCQNLTLDSYSNWRLPTIKELKTLWSDHKGKNFRNDRFFVKKPLLKYMPPLVGKYQIATFWSTDSKDKKAAYYVHFSSKITGSYSKTVESYVMCVR